MLRIAHLSDLHVGHLVSNLMRIGRLVLPSAPGESAWEIATRLVASSWFERRSLFEPLLRSIHLTHQYETRNLVAVVQSARDQGASHVILTGDVANLGAASEMREARSVFEAHGYTGDRLIVVPGNHDVVNFRGVAEFRSVMCDREWPYLVHLSDDVLVVAMDSTAHGDVLDWRDMLSMNARGVFPQESIATADALLSSVSNGAFKILCFHHHPVDLPPDGYADQWSGRLDPRLAGPAENATELLDMATRRGVGLILFEHRHRATHHLFKARGIHASCSGAVTEPDARGNLRYRIFDFDGPRVVRRRWIEVAPQEASNRAVVEALEAVSSTREDSDELRVTQSLRPGGIAQAMEKLQARKRVAERTAVERVRARLELEHKRKRATGG